MQQNSTKHPWIEKACRRLAKKDGNDPSNWYVQYITPSQRHRVNAEIHNLGLEFFIKCLVGLFLMVVAGIVGGLLI